MRGMIGLIILLIAVIWIAIAVFWIGPDIPQKNYDFPAAVPISPSREEFPVLISPEATNSATPSGEILPTPTIFLISPTVKVNLNYSIFQSNNEPENKTVSQ